MQILFWSRKVGRHAVQLDRTSYITQLEILLSLIHEPRVFC